MTNDNGGQQAGSATQNQDANANDQNNQNDNQNTKPPAQTALDLDNARKAERAAKREADELRNKLKALEDAQLSEAEKLQRRVQELETANQRYEQQQREATLRSTVAEEARKAGAVYPDELFALVREDLDDTASNAAKVIRDYKASHPLLFTTNGANGRAAENQQAGKPTGGFIRSMFRPD